MNDKNQKGIVKKENEKNQIELMKLEIYIKNHFLNQK